jgi:hypothetical protein
LSGGEDGCLPLRLLRGTRNEAAKNKNPGIAAGVLHFDVA